MVSFLEATISLVLQIAVVTLLFVAIQLKNRKKYREHGSLMVAAVILHLITVLAVMGPTFGTFFNSSGTIVFDATVIMSLIHVALGSIAVVIGIWIVASWHFKTDVKGCFTKKKIMGPTFALWTLSALWGKIMYVIFWRSQIIP